MKVVKKRIQVEDWMMRRKDMRVLPFIGFVNFHQKRKHKYNLQKNMILLRPVANLKLSSPREDAKMQPKTIAMCHIVGRRTQISFNVIPFSSVLDLEDAW